MVLEQSILDNFKMIRRMVEESKSGEQSQVISMSASTMEIGWTIRLRVLGLTSMPLE